MIVSRILNVELSEGRWSCEGDCQPDGAEVAIWFLLAANSEMWEAIHKLKDELWNKKKPALAGSENSQSLQMANNAEIKKWLLSKGQTLETHRKLWSKDDTEIVTIKSIVKTSERPKKLPYAPFI